MNKQVVAVVQPPEIWTYLTCLLDHLLRANHNPNLLCLSSSKIAIILQVLISVALHRIRTLQTKTVAISIWMHLAHQIMIQCFNLRQSCKPKSKKRSTNLMYSNSHRKWISSVLVWWVCRELKALGLTSFRQACNHRWVPIMVFSLVLNLKCSQCKDFKMQEAFQITSRQEYSNQCHNNKWDLIRLEVHKIICLADQHLLLVLGAPPTKCQSSWKRNRMNKNKKCKKVILVVLCRWIHPNSI